jgi:Flp pilus assembly protein TadG
MNTGFVRNIKKSLHRGERGQSIVEFALLAPILIILFMGIFDFGWLLHQQIQMDNAVRQAARRGAVGDTNDQMITMMKNATTFGLTDEMITIDVLDDNGTSVGDPTDRTPDNHIIVEIYRPNVQLVTPLAGLVHSISTINLHSEAEFLIE